jgi:hypothetical protein
VERRYLRSGVQVNFAEFDQWLFTFVFGDFAMNQLSALVRMLVEYAQNGNWLVVAFIASYVLFLNLKSIQEFFDKQNAKRGDFLKNSVELKSLSDTTRKVLEEELEYLIFKKITKISADKYMREAIFQVIEKSEGDLQMSSITRTR